MNKKRYLPLGAAAALAAVVSLAGCGASKIVLVTSDMSPQGMMFETHYKDDANPGDTSETNISTTQGMNGVSPMPITVTFDKGGDINSETVEITGTNGQKSTVLAMEKEKLGFGLTRSLTASVAQYQMRDIKGNNACGVKVDIGLAPSILQLFSTHGQGWDAQWFYGVPCTATTLDITHAKLYGVNISQQTVLRLTGKPMFSNRGRSVTVVGGPAAALKPGWWQYNALPNSNASILGAADLVKQMVQDLNSSPRPWMEFSPTGRFADSQLVMATGDADVYNLHRFILNRQSDYASFFRGSPTEAWHHINVHPDYNSPWNNWSSRFAEISDFSGFDPHNVQSNLNKYGFPKNPNDPVMKEIETTGCQNCPNAELAQIQLRDGNTGKIRYAMTTRGYLGATSSLMMFGKLPPSLSKLQQQAARVRKSQGIVNCPVQYNQVGQHATPADSCAELLREGAMQNLLTENPQHLGFDLVAQMQVKDNSTWEPSCSPYGNTVVCTPKAINRRLDATYKFDTANATNAWTAEQLLGPVGMNTLGFGYVSGPGTGDGMNFAMAQSVIRNQYLNGITDPEMVFALDGPVPLPGVLRAAGTELFGHN